MRTGRVRRTAQLVLLLAVAGCAVPTEHSAQRIAAKDVPFELAATSTTATEASDTDTVPVKIFLVRDDRLAEASRGTSPADPSSVLALLAQGPSQAETAAGLRTALVPDLAAIKGEEARVLTIDLEAEFNALAPTEQRLALAQITFTMTQLTAISRVKFLVAGEPASVPRGDGSSTDAPVGPEDYAQVAPLQP